MVIDTLVNGRLRRCTNPSLSEDMRQRFVFEQLMTARPEVKTAKAAGYPRVFSEALAKIQKAKVALGERTLFDGAIAALISEVQCNQYTLCAVLHFLECDQTSLGCARFRPQLKREPPGHNVAPLTL